MRHLRGFSHKILYEFCQLVKKPMAAWLLANVFRETRVVAVKAKKKNDGSRNIGCYM